MIDTLVTSREIRMEPEDLIVSKTDLRGHITYANDVFVRLCGYSETELMGQPHSIIRHPDMPRSVFLLLWNVIGAGGEVFAYVKNRAKNGDFYWVFAHVTPTFGPGGEIIAYHSNRRCPSRSAIAVLEPVYAELREVEAPHHNARAAAEAGLEALNAKLKSMGTSYSELIWSLSTQE